MGFVQQVTDAHCRFIAKLSSMQKDLHTGCFLTTGGVENGEFHSLQHLQGWLNNQYDDLTILAMVIPFGWKWRQRFASSYEYYVNIYTISLWEWWVSLSYLQCIHSLFNSMYSALCHIIVQFVSSVLRHGYLINIPTPQYCSSMVCYGVINSQCNLILYLSHIFTSLKWNCCNPDIPLHWK